MTDNLQVNEPSVSAHAHIFFSINRDLLSTGDKLLLSVGHQPNRVLLRFIVIFPAALGRR
jgi:hypothetical protein